MGLFWAALLAGCAAPTSSPPPKVPEPPACQAAAQGEALVGNWLSVRSQKGVSGELRTLFTLNADGTMAYSEQLKRGKHPSQGLSETGCWQRTQQTLTLRTLASNGAAVILDDPIYTNHYTIVSVSDKALSLTEADGTALHARRMSPGYRLPF